MNEGRPLSLILIQVIPIYVIHLSNAPKSRLDFEFRLAVIWKLYSLVIFYLLYIVPPNRKWMNQINS